MNREIIEHIQNSLDQVEQEYEVKVLYACESGSRAWGFESEDSDYDVRFIYVRQPDWYLSINVENKRDVIELPLDEVWDINGWDVRKALQLYFKTNPSLNEWLGSPIIYREEGSLAESLRQLAGQFYNSVSASYHYRSMAKKNFREYLQKDEVPLKKYLYCLRPTLAAKWIEEGRGVAPMEFESLVEGLISPGALYDEIQRLVEVKRQSGEVGTGAKSIPIHNFLREEIDRWENEAPEKKDPEKDMRSLNELFREVIQEAWE